MKRSLAQNFAFVIGWTLVFAGAVGFLYSAVFGTPGKTGSVLGILEVNGWHNVVHILTGLLGIAAARSYSGARTYAIGVAVAYAGIAIWGFVIGDHHAILSIIPVNTEDSVLHALIALGATVAGLSTPAAPAPTPAGEGPPPNVRFN